MNRIISDQHLFSLRFWVHAAARPARLALGYCWAMLFATFGLLIWNHPPRIIGFDQALGTELVNGLAILGMAGAQFVFLVLVADDICRGASQKPIMAIKVITGLVIWAALVWVLWHVGEAWI